MNGSRHSRIVGLGQSVPARVVTNDDLAKIVDTSDEWIRSRTGIGERRFAGDGETTATLAASAGRRVASRKTVERPRSRYLDGMGHEE